ncbi:hypothetical protein BN2497_13615 [Janthinobacterium sp. CG23_2]|nr:hypothetical protein BN2497_2515 [Janthinobacterium sp. CG23_2]CUI09419.1 hypothetical protein BN2497_13615 [Janthinobacterium sp. CG23_2]CUU27655.1 hypothetical protein BN3177_2515 [Janthinobacterium sp. CG23_2]CUU33205.1 hypothetical protein BN3177_13615 [Janthinobacterium sp. CG23_2]
MRIPLTWLLTSASTMLSLLCLTLWTVAGQSNKLEQIAGTSVKMEKRLDDRDEKTEAMRERMFNFDRTTDNLKLRVDALERLRK